MALKDDSTLIVNIMRFYTAAVGTVAPTATAYFEDKATALASWVEIGHTSLDSPFSVTTEGGEVTTKGSLQNQTLRTTTSAKTYALEINLEQFDADTLKHYLGANSQKVGDVVYSKSKPTSEQAAILGVAEDGNAVMFLHGGKADISANGNFDVSSIEDLASLPVKFTFLEDGDGNTFGISPVLHPINGGEGS
jgi:hypothetical protein